ncbi:hypothetical protein MARPO_1721s0001 [Marchantia polymorpha]|uniref:Uncharacterized protein n=1 Tax=Marchantia polymorpha TaxID=3197 RepID=A0A2R6VXY7_MARPO|nr:hypothetical protein MARPO_1721s0001 [Marchantia polymorpha]|eukprot:PTQ26430.1 hypothetical protein MARPO_1721s0001 [Marchantia polymorpha]
MRMCCSTDEQAGTVLEYFITVFQQSQTQLPDLLYCIDPVLSTHMEWSLCCRLWFSTSPAKPRLGNPDKSASKPSNRHSASLIH